jgi:hypothetical protein
MGDEWGYVGNVLGFLETAKNRHLPLVRRTRSWYHGLMRRHSFSTSAQSGERKSECLPPSYFGKVHKKKWRMNS